MTSKVTGLWDVPPLLSWLFAISVTCAHTCAPLSTAPRSRCLVPFISCSLGEGPGMSVKIVTQPLPPPTPPPPRSESFPGAAAVGICGCSICQPPRPQHAHGRYVLLGSTWPDIVVPKRAEGSEPEALMTPSQGPLGTQAWWGGRWGLPSVGNSASDHSPRCPRHLQAESHPCSRFPPHPGLERMLC